MSGENIVVFGTTKTLSSSGGAISNNAVVQATTANYDIVSDGSSYPDAEFVLTATFATLPTENTTLALYARPLDVDGTSDTEIPEITRPTTFIGSFVVNNVISTQTMTLAGGIAFNLPKLAEYYIHNNGTGQSVSSGWVLKVTPRTNKAAP